MTETPESRRGRIDEELRRAFETERMAGGGRPLEEFLPPPGHVDRAPTLAELVCIELELRWKAWSRDRQTEKPALSDILERFPELGEGPARETLEGECAALAARFQRPVPEVGRAIGRYQLRQPVGQGGFAHVWRAFDPTLQRDVALKLVRTELCGDEEVRLRIQREAQAVARLQHPGIVPVYEVGEHPSAPFLVSEFVPGDTLADRITAGPLAQTRAAEIALRLADALEYAHQCGIVHRDVKPTNVLMRADGSPALTDFGLAHSSAFEATLTRRGDVLGTPAYMAPEQAVGAESVDARCDVYAAGVVLYEMLTGLRPFRGDSSTAVLYAVVHEEPEAVRRLRPEVSADLASICGKAMAKERDRRYRTAAELAGDLRRFLRKEPIQARRHGPLARLRLWSRRNPALAATVVIAVATVLLVSGIGLHQVLAERDQATQALYRALVGEAEARMQARHEDWDTVALANLRQAATMDVAGRDQAALRDLVIRCLGAKEAVFHLSGEWPADPLGAVERLAVTVDGAMAICVHRAGAVSLRRMATGERVLRLPSRLGASAVAAHPARSIVAFGEGGGAVELWDVSDDSPRRLARVATPGGVVHGLAFHPDGAAIAAASADGGVRVLSERGDTWQLTHTVDAHQGAALCVSWTREAGLVSGGEDGAVRAPDPDGARAPLLGTDRDPVRYLALAPGDALAYATWEGYGYSVLFPDGRNVAGSGRHANQLRALLALPSGGLVSVAADGALKSWHPALTERAAVRSGAMRALTAAGDPSGERVVVGYGDGSVRVWELAASPVRDYWKTQHSATFLPRSGRLVKHASVREYRADGPPVERPHSLALATSLVVGLQGEVLVATAAGALRSFGGPGGNAAAVSSFPEEVALVVGAGDSSALATAAGAVHLREGSGPWRQLGRADVGPVRALAVDGDTVLVAGDRGCVAVDTSGEVEILVDEPVPRGGVAAAAGVRAVTTTGGALLAWQGGGRRPRRLVEGGVPMVVALHPSGRQLVAADTDGRLRAFDLQAGTEAAPVACGVRPPAALRYSPDGDRILVVGLGSRVLDGPTRRPFVRLEGAAVSGTFAADGGVVLAFGAAGVHRWSAQRINAAQEAARSAWIAERTEVPQNLLPTECPMPGSHLMTVWAIVASPDGGRVVTTSYDGSVKLWDTQDMQLLADLRGTDGAISWTAAFSVDSELVAVGVDRRIELWRVSSPRRIGVFDDHEELVSGLAFHPSRPVLASSGLDGTVRIRRVPDGTLLGVLYRGDSVHGVAFSPDGQWLAAALDGGAAALWRLAEGAAPPADGTAPEIVLPGKSATWVVAFDPWGRYFATGHHSGDVVLYRADDFERLAMLRGDSTLVRSVSFGGADGNLMAVGCYQRNSLTWNLAGIRAVLADMGLNWR